MALVISLCLAFVTSESQSELLVKSGEKHRICSVPLDLVDLKRPVTFVTDRLVKRPLGQCFYNVVVIHEDSYTMALITSLSE